MLNELTNQINFFWMRKNVQPREGQLHEHDKVKGSRQDWSDNSQISKLLNLLHLFSFIHMLFARYIIHDTLWKGDGIYYHFIAFWQDFWGETVLFLKPNPKLLQRFQCKNLVIKFGESRPGSWSSLNFGTNPSRGRGLVVTNR